ncbi:MAG TPA: glycosyltransferase family 39 protein [Vicinamibacterales bacterium]|nr:glycosyltransferase family 39 protein [Vicinamibacterales bacterium]
MPRRRFLTLAIAILALGAMLRVVWLRADPPTTSVGVVWHDEGAWTHNARNRALWGTWITDNWNPVYIAPVFTALEYAAFRVAGVGQWQARTVPAASGLIAIAALMAGLAAAAGRRVALVGGLLLATEFTWVMWNRAALMESTMTMFMVVAWAGYALAQRHARWGAAAGAAAALAWFTKAAAAFFVAAIVLDALLALVMRGRSAEQVSARRAAWWTLAGGALAGGAIVAAFVWPHWREYWFYNVQMSVERKPSYAWRNLVDRASWIPVTQDIVSRLWPLLAAAALAIGNAFARLRESRPAERLLVWWLLLGLLELTVHDSGNERRYVMLIPPIVALASMGLASGAAWVSAQAVSATVRARLLFAPVALALLYLLCASALRSLLVDKAAEHPYQLDVRLSAVMALAGVAVLLFRWRPVVSWLATHGIAWRAAVLLIGSITLWNLGQFTGWAAHRTDFNYRASVELGRLLPPGTLVQGKLANGLDLENRIRPIFIGNGFGNYADRLDRDDVRYILTYDLPSLGYESQHEGNLISEILDRYPQRQPVATFDVEETTGPDRAVLIDKHARNK